MPNIEWNNTSNATTSDIGPLFNPPPPSYRLGGGQVHLTRWHERNGG